MNSEMIRQAEKQLENAELELKNALSLFNAVCNDVNEDFIMDELERYYDEVATRCYILEDCRRYVDND